ncbi:hypothetical protein PLEOSDRAFT_1109725 [Pleurotus ostreatus PC15]|uniref:Uncharacterized protein n=1 Tax=Pleurotus ostreatus (strain PC15) TaxID=1137138 RepID=A0A067NES9_PLEO1|nr:hypothetical protein PLEOSDRAFT_1109725 [Pleurotus ostreatus PC15]
MSLTQNRKMWTRRNSKASWKTAAHDRPPRITSQQTFLRRHCSLTESDTTTTYISLARLHVHEYLYNSCDLPRKILVQPVDQADDGVAIRIVGPGGTMTFEMFMNGQWTGGDYSRVERNLAKPRNKAVTFEAVLRADASLHIIEDSLSWPYPPAEASAE